MAKIIDSVLTLGKVALKSRSVGKRPRVSNDRRLIIMGNGPSLRTTIDENADKLQGADLMAVNFAANTPEFFMLKPKHYVVADPHFFNSAGDPAVGRVWENLSLADWPVVLHLPVTAMDKPEVRKLHNITLRPFNMTPGEGYSSLCHWLYRHGLAMPRPRNVLIPAIMEGIREGYREIVIVGADHTWPHTLYVDDDNRVVTVQPHFYEDNKKELDRIADAYKGVHVHDILGSMTIAFKSYHQIKEYADREGVAIFNSTPGSLIDAFPRRPL